MAQPQRQGGRLHAEPGAVGVAGLLSGGRRPGDGVVTDPLGTLGLCAHEEMATPALLPAQGNS